MGTRIKTRLRIAAHPFFNFFYNTIHLPHTTPRLALDADESVCCVRPLCLTLSSFASLRVWAMLNLFLLFFHFTPPSTFLVRSVTSSSISTRYFDDILQAYPDKDNSPSHDGNVCIHPPPTRSAPSWPSGAKPQLRLVIHTCASENLISEKHNGQAGPERPFSPPSSKGAMARSEQEVDELAFRFGRSKTPLRHVRRQGDSRVKERLCRLCDLDVWGRGQADRDA